MHARICMQRVAVTVVWTGSINTLALLLYVWATRIPTGEQSSHFIEIICEWPRTAWQHPPRLALSWFSQSFSARVHTESSDVTVARCYCRTWVDSVQPYSVDGVRQTHQWGWSHYTSGFFLQPIYAVIFHMSHSDRNTEWAPNVIQGKCAHFCS